MTNDPGPRAINLDDLKWWVEYAKSMPSYQDALYFENALRLRLFGDESSEKMELLDSIKKYYSEKFEETILYKATERISAKIKSLYNIPKISLGDKQIAEAIVLIQHDFKSSRDYFSIYRILVDFCAWPETMTDFCEDFTRLPIHETLTYTIQYDEKNQSKSSLYQSIQKGKGDGWPDNYQKWKTFTGDSTFEHRKDVATKFLDILRKLEKEYYSDTI